MNGVILDDLIKRFEIFFKEYHSEDGSHKYANFIEALRKVERSAYVLNVSFLDVFLFDAHLFYQHFKLPLLFQLGAELALRGLFGDCEDESKLFIVSFCAQELVRFMKNKLLETNYKEVTVNE